MSNIDSIADQVRYFNVTTRTIHVYEDKALLSPKCQVPIYIWLIDSGFFDESA